MVLRKINLFLRQEPLLELLYCIFAFCLAFTKGSSMFATFPVISKLMMIFGLTCWLLKMVLTSYTKYELIVIGMIFMLVFLSIAITGRFGILVAAMTITGLKSVSIYKVLMICFILKVSEFAYSISAEFIHVLQGGHWNGFYHPRKILGAFDISKPFRFTLGFGHPNELQKTVFLITLLFIYIYYNKISAIVLCALMFVNIVFYSLSWSNTGLVAMMILVICIMVLRKSNKWAERLAAISPFVFLTITIGIIVASYFYNDNSVLHYLNQFMTGRLSISNEYMMVYPISLFGIETDINNTVTSYGIDCGWVYMVLSYGLVIYGAYIGAVAWSLWHFKKKGYYLEIIVIMVMSFYFMMENFMMISFNNYILILLGILLFKADHKGIRKDGEKYVSR